MPKCDFNKVAATLLKSSFGMGTCVYQGVRNVSFSENFAYALNK